MKITKTYLKTLIREALEDEALAQQATDVDAAGKVTGSLAKKAAIGLLKLLKRDSTLVGKIEDVKAASDREKAQFLAFLSTNLLAAELGDIMTAAKSAQTRQTEE